LPSNKEIRTDNSSEMERGKRSMFSALGYPNFRNYWLGVNVLFFAGMLVAPAQAWLAYQLTHSALQLTLVAAMQAFPMVVLAPFSGVIIDRVQKRDVIIIAQIVTLVLAVTIAVLIATGHIHYWHLLVSSFISGITWAFGMTARNSITAELVPGDKLYTSISLTNAGANVAGVVGPAISGILIGAFGVQGAYFAGIGFYLIGLLIISQVPPTSKLGQETAGSIGKNMSEGLGYLRLHRLIIIILIMEMAITLFGASYQGLMPVFADLLHADSTRYGFMLAAVGIGSTIGALGLASLGNFKRKGLVLLFGGLIFGVILVLFANAGGLGKSLHLGSNSYFLALILLVVIGISFNSYTTTSNTVVQMNVENEYRGRMTSLYCMVIGFYPIGSLIIGALAETMGAPLALTIFGSCLVLSMIIAFTLRRMRRLE
jgi:MFS family permease